MDTQQIHILLSRYFDGQATEAERAELRALMADGAEQEGVKAVLNQMLQSGAAAADYEPLEWAATLEAIVGVDRPVGVKARGRVHWMKRAWVRYAAAVIILFGIGAYLWNTQQTNNALVDNTKPVPVENDVAPGSNKAVLTLSDGRKVELGAETRAIAEADVAIRNSDGRLEYGQGARVVYNTMATPRGGQYQLSLPDGTRVWLNAASSITYPTAFTGKTREVVITGEAYFEVATNKAKPFVVRTPKEAITVLGTRFNVNAYGDEAAMKTSLVDGAVKVGGVVLQPGQAYSNGKVGATNVEQDVAWKNGVFNFHKMPLHQVMRQLARWYDLTVIYEPGVKDILVGGEMGRDLTLSQVLTILSDMQVKYRLEGKQLTIL